MKEDPLPIVSLLWPDGAAPPQPVDRPRFNADCPRDLGLETAVRGLSLEPRHAQAVQRILLELPDDAAVIRYRQDVLDDLLHCPTLPGSLERVLSRLQVLQRYRLSGEPLEPLREVARRVAELSVFAECIRLLAGLPGSGRGGPAGRLRSAGLLRLRQAARSIRDQEVFRRLARELPQLLARVRSFAGITVGINLGADLQPESAVLLEVHGKPFQGGRDSLLSRLLGAGGAGGAGRANGDGSRGLAPLHPAHPPTGTLAPLFRDLSEVTARVCRPVTSALRQYLSFNARVLAPLADELAFYLGAARLVGRFREQGLPWCRPELAAREERLGLLESAWNLNLGLRLAERGRNGGSIVLNDVEIGRRGALFVLTGPNRGGKTTYVQGIGLALLLGQAGLYVPARRARLSPVDGIYTHFPGAEHPEMDAGKLGEEALRMGEIFSMATPDSLILLNESLTNTSPRESLELSRDVLRAIRALGARAIVITHLHELAAEAEAEEGVVSLVSQVQDDGAENGGQPTFRIVAGPPAGRSHAAEVAERYGISYRQLIERLQRRGLVK